MSEQLLSPACSRAWLDGGMAAINRKTPPQRSYFEAAIWEQLSAKRRKYKASVIDSTAQSLVENENELACQSSPLHLDPSDERFLNALSKACRARQHAFDGPLDESVISAAVNLVNGRLITIADERTQNEVLSLGAVTAAIVGAKPHIIFKDAESVTKFMTETKPILRSAEIKAFGLTKQRNGNWKSVCESDMTVSFFPLLAHELMQSGLAKRRRGDPLQDALDYIKSPTGHGDVPCETRMLLFADADENIVQNVNRTFYADALSEPQSSARFARDLIEICNQLSSARDYVFDENNNCQMLEYGERHLKAICEYYHGFWSHTVRTLNLVKLGCFAIHQLREGADYEISNTQINLKSEKAEELAPFSEYGIEALDVLKAKHGLKVHGAAFRNELSGREIIDSYLCVGGVMPDAIFSSTLISDMLDRAMPVHKVDAVVPFAPQYHWRSNKIEPDDFLKSLVTKISGGAQSAIIVRAVDDVVGQSTDTVSDIASVRVDNNTGLPPAVLNSVLAGNISHIVIEGLRMPLPLRRDIMVILRDRSQVAFHNVLSSADPAMEDAVPATALKAFGVLQNIAPGISSIFFPFIARRRLAAEISSWREYRRASQLRRAYLQRRFAFSGG